ncbi:hypothetical protein BY996DRAFT_6409494 [Phakopsora pachyrhizi]|nr:hypothetical protein BY996DRAFT_6409494 [Phakopsora pachyrhizi]
MSYTDEEQLQHLLNLGALVDSPVTHQEHKGIITKLYDFYKRCLETEPGEEEPQVPSAAELCSALPKIQADDASITTTQAEEPSITTTQAAEIEASSDSVSKTIKHQLSHQSIQNTLPPTKRHSKRLQALPKTQAGRVLQGFQSSYSLRNPTGQGLIPQGGIPISAKDWTSTNGEQIQENENSTDNVPVTQENPNEQPLFRDEEQLESETQVPTEEAPITSGSQQALPAGLRFQKKTPLQKEAPQLNINHFLPRQSTSKSVSQTCSELIREGSTSSSVNVGFQSGAVTSIEESLKICGRKITENEELDMVYKALPSFIVDHCKSEKILQMPNSDLIMKPEWINLQALESTITMKAGDIETLALILCPFAELPKWAYVDLGNVVEEVCEMMRAVDDNFRPSTVFKNIDPKSSSGFIVVYEELLTVLLRSSSLKTHYGPDGESVIAPSIQAWSISSPRMQQNQKSNLNNSVSIAYQIFFFLDLELFLQQIVKIIESKHGGTHWQDWKSQR